MTNRHKILFVDDEPNILSALARMLQDETYQVFTATSADAGIALIEEEDEIDVVVSDYRMPERNGVDFLKEVHDRWPLTVRMVLSGFADMPAVIDAINEGKIYRFVPKPWDLDELKEAIAEGLALRAKADGADNSLRVKLQKAEERNVQLERQLAEYRKKLDIKDQFYEQVADILNALPLGLIGIDDSGQIVFSNQLAEEYFAAALTGTAWNRLAQGCSMDVLKNHLGAQGAGKTGETTINIGGRRLRLKLNYLRPTTRRGILLTCEGVNNEN